MESRAIFLMVVVLFTLCHNAHADYECLCNYRVETPMYGKLDKTSSPVGYLYEFDCKPIAPPNNQQAGWVAIMNEHMIAYVEKGDGLANQVCQGSIPSDDKLFSTSTTSTTTKTILTTTKPTTSKPTTASPSTTSTSTTATTTTPTTTRIITQTTTKYKTMSTTKPATTPKPTTTNIATSTPTTSSSTTTATTTTKQTTPSTITMLMTTKQAKHTKTTPPSTAWSTTSDWLIYWNITHSPYTTRKPHHTTDPTKPWQTTHPHAGQNHTGNSTHGNLQKCPGVLTRSVNAKWLRQYKGHCYELVRQWKDWYDAETDCWQRLGHGGELVEIYTQAIQHYILDFMHEVQFNHDVWIGLQDIDREEHFAWDSGRSMTYTNWNPNRKGNQLPHKKEDCVYMQSNGRWEDSLCSYVDIQKRFLVNANSVNTRRPYICQYPSHNFHHGK